MVLLQPPLFTYSKSLYKRIRCRFVLFTNELQQQKAITTISYWLSPKSDPTQYPVSAWKEKSMEVEYKCMFTLLPII